jgi:hypothetical protein
MDRHEGFIPVEEGVSLWYTVVGDGPQTVVPLALTCGGW